MVFSLIDMSAPPPGLDCVVEGFCSMYPVGRTLETIYSENGKKGQFMNNFTPSSLFQTNPGEASILNDAKEDMF